MRSNNASLLTHPILAFAMSVLALFAHSRMIAKKWRPLKFFTAEEYEWAWNNFDFWVVVLSVLGGLDIIPGLGNQVQLFRLLRVLKLLKMIVELQMILRGLAAGISSVLYVAMLMLLIFYLYGCIGFILYRDEVSPQLVAACQSNDHGTAFTPTLTSCLSLWLCTTGPGTF